MDDLFGKALFDYFQGDSESSLILHNKFGEPDSLELDGYFFEPDELPDFDMIALDFCQGNILDIGAAAGRHSLYLQSLGKKVTALDISEKCVELMTIRGVKNILHKDIYKLKDQKFDTLFLLMNGLGISKNIWGFRQLLGHARNILDKNGIFILDSADVSYLKERYALPEKEYFGEIDYRFEYKGELGKWFTWLYLDQKKLTSICEECGWKAHIIYTDPEGQYLSILTQ